MIEHFSMNFGKVSVAEIQTSTSVTFEVMTLVLENFKA